MKKLLVGMVAVLALVTCANAGTVIIGSANSDNCIPWSCPSITGGSPYEQIYNSSAFSGSINIGDIEFYNTYYNNPGQATATFDYSIYLAVTSQSVPDGSTPPGEVLFASGHMNSTAWTFGNTLTFNGTPFLYDPTKGNLELVVDISNASDPPNGAYVYFDAETGGPFSRWCPNCGSNQGYGLVTGFSEAQGTTPEPSSLLLTASGLLAVAGVIRRKWAK